MRMLQLGRKRQRVALALTTGEGLLVRLNCASPPKRTRELVELVRTLREIMTRETAAEAEGQPVGDRINESRLLYRRANELLSACHWSPRIWPLWPDQPRDYMAWNARTEQSDWGNRFVLWILRVLAQGDILRIRTCRNCHRWFYAVTNHQTHCSDRCRQHLHSRNVSFKEKRRLYMRRYREAEKSRHLVAKKLLNTGPRIANATLHPDKRKGGL